LEIKITDFLSKLLATKNKNITIVSHVNPDGDAVGSTMGLYHFLKNDLQENVHVILPGNFPTFLAWIPGSDNIIIAEKDKNRAFECIERADIIFCLDFNDTQRTGILSQPLQGAAADKFLIDHHPNPKDEFKYQISDIHVSSTAELVYELIVSLGKQHLIDITIAQCLYTGIVTDTGSFSYACNNPRTYYITGHFINLGLDGEHIHRLVYDNYSEDRIRLIGQSLSQNLKTLPDYGTAYIFLSQSDLQRYNYSEGDSEGVVNYALSIKGVSLAAIFIERKDLIKISFRSEGDVNVNYLARQYFDGGGHKNASGGSSKQSLSSTIEYFEQLIAELSKDDFSALKVVQDNA
jgi:bifunctional oligoribonuclease and PAP phosphatase NrnA